MTDLYNFGLSGYVGLVMYIIMIGVILASLRWPIVGLYYLIPLLPLQSVRSRLDAYPAGASMMTIVLLAMTLGLLFNKEKVFVRSPLTWVLGGYSLFTFVSLIFGTFNLGREFPFAIDDPRLVVWRNLVTMFYFLIVTLAIIKTPKQIRILFTLMCVSILLFNQNFWSSVKDKDFSSYSNDLRDIEGAAGYAGINGLAALEAQAACMLLGMSGFLEKRKHRWAVVGIATFSAICCTYSLSRGGYAGFLVGWVFLGIVKYRKLLVALALFAATWTMILPNAVVERVNMTTGGESLTTQGDLDHSSATRVSLWQEALQETAESPIIGRGFDTYAYMEHLSGYLDSHNIYLKVLVEMGYVGLALFLGMFFQFFRVGIKLMRTAKDRFNAGLGLALAAWMVATFATNMFGDRFTHYPQVAGFTFVLGGLVCRALILEREATETEDAEESAETLPQGLQWRQA